MDHKNSYSASYAAAGVDITAGYRAVELMKKHISRTRNEGCLDDLGGFGGCFGLPLAGMEEPVLVSGTDGCGTKVKLAILMDKHDTIGIDCVAMCVNDIICVGAKPLFFLDYIACGKNVPEKIAEIVGGVAEGCVQSGAALIGGETAEHPGMMPVEDYDLAGFAVGIVDKKKILDKTKMAEGDAVIALASSGIHSNGFSLIRKVFRIDENPAEIYQPCDALGGKTIAETLLTPTKIYVKSVLALLEKVDVKGISHITGGGTNLQALIDAQQRGELGGGEITAVISSKEGAYALERARKAGIPGYVLPRKSFDSNRAMTLALVEKLKVLDIDLVVLAGCMVIFTEELVQAYPNAIMNVHPALIPSFCGQGFYGLHVHEAALAYGVKLSGATVHFVSAECDGGPIIAQKAVPVLPGDTPETLQKRIMEQAEWKLLPEAVRLFCEGRLRVEGRTVIIEQE